MSTFLIRNFRDRSVARGAGSIAIVAAILLAVSAAPVNAATVAADDASNYSSFGAFSAANQGTGFGAWTFTGDDSNTANEGSYLNTSSKAISLATKAWGFYANAGHIMEGKRAFTGTLSTAQTFQIDLQSDGVDTGTGHGTPPGASNAKQFGFELRSGSTARFRFYFVGGQSNCKYDDSTAANDTAAGGFPSGGFRVVFRLLTADTYEFAVLSPINGSIIYASGTRTLGGTAGSGIDSVACYVNSAGTSHDCYFNSMKISYDSPSISAQPASTTATCAGTTTSAMTVTAASTDGSTISYAWRKRGTGWGNAWTFNDNGGSHFLATSPEIDNSGTGKAWGLQQTTNTTGATEAYRALPAALAVNQTIQLDFDNKNIAGGGSVGVSLQNSAGANAFEFKFAGGGTNYNINDNSGNPRDTGIPFTNAGIRLRFTLTSATTYSLQVIRMAKGDTIVLTGTTLTVTGGIQRIRFFASGSGASNNVYFNNVKVAGADDDSGNYTTWSGDAGQKALADGATGNGGAYSGSATSSFTITNPAAGDAGSYDCAVMSGQGYMVISTASALTVNATPTVSTPASSNLPAANHGQAYSQSFNATGGGGSYTWSLAGGTLPTGLNLSAAGVLSGTTTADGNYVFTVQATDGNGCSGSKQYNLTVASCPAITLSSLNSGTVATAYSQTITASGGTGPYTFSLFSGTLPNGLTLDSGGNVTGTPNASGTSTFTVLATDANGCTGSQSYSLTINCPNITLSPGSPLPGGTTGTAYSQAITAGGMSGSFTFSVTSGSSPAGLTLSSGGVLSGTPTASGTATFDVTATSASYPSCSGVMTYSLTIGCQTITVTPATLPNLVLTAVYSANGNTVAATGGTAPYTFAISTGALPTGLSMNTSGVISGTPTTVGSYNFTIQATDVNSCTGNTAYTVVVGTGAVVTNPANQSACAGSTATFSVTGSGTPTLGYAWSKNSNAGWGNAWSVTGSAFRGSSTNNDNSEASCTSFSNVAHDINSPSGNALGMFGVASATRALAAISTFPTVVSIDFDNGGVDAGVKNGFSLQTAAGADVLQFYFLGGQANYKYNDGTERDTVVGFQRQGVRVKFVLLSPTSYKLLVTPCGGVTHEFNGVFSGAIAKLKLFSNNTSAGSPNDTYFNNFQIGGYVDNADNYTGIGTWTGTDNGDAPIAGANSSSFTTPTLTIANNGDKYQVVASNAYGSFLSGAATLTVNPLPAAFNVSGGGAYCSGDSGVPIGLTNSETGKNYQLYRNGGVTAVGSPVAGTGSAISFGNQTVADTYTVVATNATSGCTAPMTGSATVTVDQPPTTAATGPGQSVCGLASESLGGDTPVTGTGTWSKVSGPGNVVFSDNHSGSATATVDAYGAYAFRWTISNGTCPDSTADVSVVYSQTPTAANAGPNQTFTETDSTTLAGNTPTIGTGTWSRISGTGTITSLHDPATSVTSLGYGANTFRWTIHNGACADSISDVVITRKHSQTITGLPATDTKTYGAAPYNLSLTGGDSGNPITYNSSNTAAAAVDASGIVTIVGAGSTTITASQAGNADYAAAPDATQNLTVNKKALTVTGLTGDNKVYDGNNTATFTGTAALSGVINSDDVTLSGTPAATFADKNVGNAKTITVSGYTLTGTKAGNYTLTQPTLSGNISAKDINVTADTGQFKAKGASDPTFTYSADSLFSGDSYTGALSRDSGEAAGSYAITIGSLTAGSNYAIHFTGASFVVTGPIALADSASRLSNSTSIEIPLTTLLANDSRIVSDGSSATDNLSITAVNDGAGNHVSISGSSVVYQPTDPSASDPLTFTYTLSDGTSTDTGTVTVTTNGTPPLLLEIVSKTGPVYDSGTDTTTLTVYLIGVPNQAYSIDYSTNLLTTWTAYPANPVDTGGTGAFTVTLSASGDQTAAWKAVFFRANE